MNTQSPETETKADGLIIMGDDLAPQGTAAPAQAVQAAQESKSGADVILAATDGFSIGSLGRSLLAKFIGENADELSKFEAVEREKRSVANQDKFFRKTLADWGNRMAQFENTILLYQSMSLPQTIFEQCWTQGKSFYAVANSPEVQTCVLLKAHGADVLKLLKLEHADLQNKYRNFRRENKVLLQQLGL